MEVSMLSQLLVFTMSIFIGVVLGIIYDAIRIFRAFLGVKYKTKLTDRLEKIKFPLITNPFKKKGSRIGESVALFITDIIYFLLATLALIVFIYYVNDGIVRWYIFLGAIVGMLAYYFSIGKFAIAMLEFILFFARVLLAYFFYLLSFPFVRALRKIKAHFWKRLCKLKERRQERKTLQKTASKRQELMRAGK